MGFDLGGLGSITKMFDPGNLVKQAVNSVLPKNMAVVGDVAGAIFDLNTGNPLGAAQLGMDAMKDLPQATKSMQQQPGQQAAVGTARGAPLLANAMLEPSPPPQGKPIDMNALLDILKQLTALLGGAKTDGSKGGADAPDPAASSKASDTSANTASSSASTSSRPGTTTTTTTTTTTGATTSGWRGSPAEAGATAEHTATHGWRGEPRTPAPSPTTQAPAPATTTASSSSATAASSTPATSSTPAAPAAPAASAPAAPSSASSGGETISSMAQLNTMSDGAIRDAVIHGRISPELAKDQTAMMAIQQRMNSISEMNNLMTNMMRALHDMQMAVVQNIRI